MPPLKSPEILEGAPFVRHGLRSAGDLPIWPSKVDRQEQLRTFFDAGQVGQVGNDMGEAAMSGAEAAAPMVGDAAQAGASAAMSGAQAAAPMLQDAASSAANAVMSGAQSAAPVVGDAATALASNLGDAASNIGDDNGCFPASALVMGRHGPIRMEDLRLGDELECAQGDFSPVIAMLHRSPGTKMTYLRIQHDRGSLAVSSNHLLYLCQPGADGSWRWAPAADVRPGDLLQHAAEVAVVLSVSVEVESGVFAPLTLCSTLLVDGVLCSCFAPPEELGLSHSLCHRALAPLRFWYYARRNLEASTTVRMGENCQPILTLDACWLPLPTLRDGSTLHPYADTLLFAFRTLRWVQMRLQVLA